MTDKLLRTDLEETLTQALSALTSTRLRGLWGDDRCKLLRHVDEVAGRQLQKRAPLGDPLEVVSVGKRKSRSRKGKDGSVMISHSATFTNRWDGDLLVFNDYAKGLRPAPPPNKPSSRRLVALARVATMKFDCVVAAGRDEAFCEKHTALFDRLRRFVSQGDAVIRLGGTLA